jgi:D-arabinose 1-dehydrogenase-like Zn-dependent alcohol dehydrogenase
LLPPKRLLPSPTIWLRPTLRHFSAPALRFTTRYAIPARAQAIWSPCKASAASVISESNTRELQKFGGAKVILATAPDSKSISSVIDGLTPNGRLLVVGASGESLSVTPIQLIRGRSALQGWASGIAPDSEDTMQFSALSGVRPMIEKYPLEKAAEAYDQMISGRARFRVVLTMAG